MRRRVSDEFTKVIEADRRCNPRGVENAVRKVFCGIGACVAAPCRDGRRAGGFSSRCRGAETAVCRSGMVSAFGARSRRAGRRNVRSAGTAPVRRNGEKRFTTSRMAGREVSVCAAGSGPRFAGRSGRVPPCGRPGGGEFPFGPWFAAVPRSEAAGLGFSGIIRNFTLAKANCGL